MKPINSIIAYIDVLITNFQKQWIFIVCLTIFCIVPVRTIHGTTVIVIRNADGVFIGADSITKEREQIELNCKIMQANDIFFAFAGYDMMFRPSFVTFEYFSIKGIIIFNALDIATEAGNIEGTIRDKVNYFDKRIKTELKEALDTIHWIDKDTFRNAFVNADIPPLSAVIAGFEKGRAIFFERDYCIDRSDVTHIKIKVDPYDSIYGPVPDIVMIGTHTAIEQSIRRYGKPTKLNPIKSIQEWITLQASATPSKVGLPIDILRIAPGKVGWIQHKPQCPEIKTEIFKKSNK